MSKKLLKQKETQVSAGDGSLGRQIEQTLTVDDMCLPSPQELAAYNEINPQIVKFLISASVKEQEHRHEMDIKKIETIRREEKRTYRINIIGMTFAFLLLAALLSLAAFMLYLGHKWFASFFGLTTIISAISLFIMPQKNK